MTPMQPIETKPTTMSMLDVGSCNACSMQQPGTIYGSMPLMMNPPTYATKKKLTHLPRRLRFSPDYWVFHPTTGLCTRRLGLHPTTGLSAEYRVFDPNLKKLTQYRPTYFHGLFPIESRAIINGIFPSIRSWSATMLLQGSQTKILAQ